MPTWHSLMISLAGERRSNRLKAWFSCIGGTVVESGIVFRMPHGKTPLYAVFKVDLRYWFMALKPMSPAQLPIFLVYLIPFSVSFLVALRNLHAAPGVRTHSAGMDYLVNIVALVAGFVLLLAFQYGTLFTSGHVATFFMNDALRTIVAINFLPLMSIVAVIATFTFRRTATYVPGAVICAALVSWYVVVGQATQQTGLLSP